MSVELTFVIVNWNGEKFLPQCLKSIIENPPKVSYEIVVIDNASTDKSLVWFETDEAKNLLQNIQFELIRSQENLGFGKANNVVINQTQSPYIFLLNPDTIIKPNSVDLLLVELNSDSKIGAVAPRLLNSDESLQPSVWYYPPTPLKIILENFKLYKLLPADRRAKTLLYSHWEHNEKRAVPIVWGAAILFKGGILKSLDGFDQDFDMYGEDMDLCIRLSKSGFDLKFVPEAEIIHLGGQSAIQHWSESAINDRKVKMGILFEKKHLNPWLFYSNYLTRLLIESVKLISYPLIGRETKNLKKSFKLQISYLRNFNKHFKSTL